jgi:hypothetical protein
MLAGNGLAWCIPPARRIFEREAAGHWHTSFAEAQRDLGVLALFVSPVAFVLACVGVIMFSLAC